MIFARILGGVVFAAGLFAGTPASAQFFLKSYDFRGAPVTGTETDIGLAMPGATPDEIKAGMLWNLRAALNVAALQCDFEPMLMTVGNYNAMLKDHQAELKGSFDTLNAYFTRTNKAKNAGQTALDRFGTRTYAAFATVNAQLGFCQVASHIGREAIFAPRGQLATVAFTYMRELRNSLVPYGEQQFPRAFPRSYLLMPSFDEKCWKKGKYLAAKCSTAG
jgi:hypothetical protein